MRPFITCDTAMLDAFLSDLSALYEARPEVAGDIRDLFLEPVTAIEVRASGGVWPDLNITITVSAGVLHSIRRLVGFESFRPFAKYLRHDRFVASSVVSEEEHVHLRDKTVDEVRGLAGLPPLSVPALQMLLDEAKRSPTKQTKDRR